MQRRLKRRHKVIFWSTSQQLAPSCTSCWIRCWRQAQKFNARSVCKIFIARSTLLLRLRGWRVFTPSLKCPARVLVVDDDRISNRLVVAALRNAHMEAHSTVDPAMALQWLKERHHDVL